MIAGPNGSGKTTITQQFLHHEWSDGVVYINPDQVANDIFGDFTLVFFIATEHPSINAARITNRVIEGGHSVPIDKIISRYYKSIMNCETIADKVDRLYVYDNSKDGERARPLFRLIKGIVGKMYVNELPEWALHILPDSNTSDEKKNKI